MTTIDEIEALLARATPGPWVQDEWLVDAPGLARELASCASDSDDAVDIANAKLIVALRNSASDLIAVVRAAAKVATPNGMHLTTEAWGALEEALAKLGVRP